MHQELKNLAIALYQIDAVKFGEFVTKIGLKTPVYFDLRVIIAHPDIMQQVATSLWKLSQNSENAAQICGVPYTALPIATLISANTNIPMLIKRKEAKDYGTKKLIEGKFSAGDSCIIIEDVVTSGSSILETVQVLKKEGLEITDTLVVIDREQGGKKYLEKNGIRMKSLFTVSELMSYLLEAEKISRETVDSVTTYIESSQAPDLQIKNITDSRLNSGFTVRSNQTKNSLAAKLFQIMEMKQSLLCLSVDMTDSTSILDLADLVGPHIAVLKTHIDIVENSNESFIKNLKDLSKKHNFLLMEDRKFADIGNTVSLQYQKGIYKIAEWADLVTVHAIAGPTIIDGLKHGLTNITEPRGIFILAQMSSKNALTTGDYVKKAIEIAESSDFVVGVVCQDNIFSNHGLIQLTPGVKLSKSSDNLGQQYNTPETVVNAGADLVVVGRGITEATDKLAVTLEYKNQLWTAYQKRINEKN